MAVDATAEITKPRKVAPTGGTGATTVITDTAAMVASTAAAIAPKQQYLQKHQLPGYHVATKVR